MAFSIKTSEEKRQKIDFGLADPVLLQDLQDQFCIAHNVYLACLSKKHGVITKAYGSKEELSYLHSKMDMDMHVNLLNHLINSPTETMIEAESNETLAKMCGIAVRVNGDIAAIWIVIGVMAEVKEQVPSYMMRTTEEDFYKSIRFLETVSKQLFVVKQEEYLAQEAFIVSRALESEMEEELRRNSALVSIVKAAESELSSTEMIDSILKQTGEYLHISNCVLIQENISNDCVDMICEYAKSEQRSVLFRSQNMKKASLPFFDGKPYMFSANAVMPEEFKLFFRHMQIRAGVFLPITIDDRNEIYLCFLERKNDRVWSMNDIEFLNDVRNIIQNVLARRFAQNFLTSSYSALEHILENMYCGICVWETDRKQMLYANKTCKEVLKEVFAEDGIEAYISKVLASGERYQEFYFAQLEKWIAVQCTKISWTDEREAELCTIFEVSAKHR